MKFIFLSHYKSVLLFSKFLFNQIFPLFVLQAESLKFVWTLFGSAKWAFVLLLEPVLDAVRMESVLL